MSSISLFKKMNGDYIVASFVKDEQSMRFLPKFDIISSNGISSTSAPKKISDLHIKKEIGQKTISWNEVVKTSSILIYDVRGILIYKDKAESNNEFILNDQSFHSGLYFFQIQLNKKDAYRGKIFFNPNGLKPKR